MSLVGDIQAYNLEFGRQIGHVAQDEAETIALKARNQATGAIDVDLNILDRYWRKARVRLALGGFLEVFRVAEEMLTESQAEGVAAVVHGAKTYKVKLAAKPSGMERFYLFEIQPV